MSNFPAGISAVLATFPFSSYNTQIPKLLTLTESKNQSDGYQHSVGTHLKIRSRCRLYLEHKLQVAACYKHSTAFSYGREILTPVVRYDQLSSHLPRRSCVCVVCVCRTVLARDLHNFWDDCPREQQTNDERKILTVCGERTNNNVNQTPPLSCSAAYTTKDLNIECRQAIPSQY